MSTLPQNLGLPLMQTQWAAILNPIINIPMLSGLQLSNISLKTGANIVNHLLQRTQQGWIVTDISGGAAEIYRSQPFNSTTLTLTSSAPVTVSLWVY